MNRYLVRRVFHLVPVLLGVTTLTFLLLHLTPGDPALLLAGQDATGEVVKEIRSRLGLDQPIHVQYLQWMRKTVRGDLGTSLFDDRPVLPTILSHLVPTLLLLATSMGIALAIGIPIGIVSAVRRNSWVDGVARLMALLGISMPSFWLALMVILAFAYHIRLLPVAGYGTWAHLILPSVVLGSALAAPLMRLTRSSMLEVLSEDYVRTARAKGLGEARVLYYHALKSAFLPIVTIIGLQVGALLGGTVIIETVFSWPGIGRLTYIRMIQRDYPMILGNLLVYALLLSLINLAVDLFYAFVDPRIRYD